MHDWKKTTIAMEMWKEKHQPYFDEIAKQNLPGFFASKLLFEYVLNIKEVQTLLSKHDGDLLKHMSVHEMGAEMIIWIFLTSP
jgi:hypothetical protein